MTDLKLAFRSLRATPVVSAIAALSLALGIGANTAIFSLVNSLLLRALPVREPAQLALISDDAERGISSWTNPIWEQIRDRRDLFDAACAWSTSRFNLASGGETQFVDGIWASGGLFDTLGVPAMLGRTFTATDDARGGGPDGPVAVISYGFWQRRFGGAWMRPASGSISTRSPSRSSASPDPISSGPMSAVPSTSRYRSAPSRSSAARNPRSISDRHGGSR
jgi:hypothetical protein